MRICYHPTTEYVFFFGSPNKDRYTRTCNNKNNNNNNNNDNNHNNNNDNCRLPAPPVDSGRRRSRPNFELFASIDRNDESNKNLCRRFIKLVTPVKFR